MDSRCSAIPKGTANRKVSNGEQVKRLAYLAMLKKEGPDLTGYWQRHIK